MQSRDHVIELCALAANEKEPAKLLALVEEINRLLKEREASRPRIPRRDGAD
jgi:hypothetical protein